MTLPRLEPALLLLSLAVIGGALFFQYGVHLVPCELCLAERWPWYAAIAITLALPLSGARAARVGPPLLLLLFLASAGLAFYHVGVEQQLFPGPEACTAPHLAGGSIDDLTKQLLATPVVRCDEVQWSLFGVSLAGFNLAASLAAALAAGTAWRRRRRPSA